MGITHLTTKQKQMRTLLVLAGVLIVTIGFGAAAGALSEAEDAESTEDAASSVTSLLGISADEVAEFSVTSTEGTYTLVRNEGSSDEGDASDASWTCAEAPEESLDTSKVETILNALADATATRTISANEATDDMGLDDPALKVEIALEEGDVIALSIGTPSAGSESYYALLSSESSAESDIMVISSELPDALDFTLSDLLAQEDAPKASTVTSLVIERTTESNDGEESENDASGTDAAEDSSDETSSDGNEEGGSTTTQTYVLEIGSKASGGGYYARPQGSNAVYTISADDVEELPCVTADTLAPDDVCQMDWDSVVSLDITVDDASFTIEFSRETEEDEDGDTEIVTTYYRDDQELDDLDVEDALDLINGLDAEGEAEGEAEDEADFDQLAADAEVTLTFHRDTQTHADMTLTLTPYDNNFYRVSFNGKTSQLVSKNDVADLKEALEDLLAVSDS